MQDEEEDTPGTLIGAGVVQILSGVVNLFIMSWMVSALWATVGSFVTGMILAICTLGLCPLPIGMVGALAWIVIVPVALIEITSGILVIVMGRRMKAFALVTSILEGLTTLVGNPVGAVAGLVSLILAVMS